MRHATLFTTVFFLAIGFVPHARAEQVKALNRGDQSLSAFFQAIQSAKQTIDIATYELEPCQSAPKVLFDAVIKRAKAGVKVRIVVESYSFKDPNRTALATWLHSQSENIEMRKNGTSAIIAGEIARSHTKTLVIDGAGSQGAFIVGGRNWTDEYFGLSSKLNYVDQDVIIQGAIANHGYRYFNELWENSGKVNSTGDARAFGASCMAMNARDQAVSQFLTANSASILAQRSGHACSNFDYEIDDPKFQERGCGADTGPDAEYLQGECFRRKRTTNLVLNFMKDTRKTLVLNNQYYFPWNRVRTLIDRLRERGKKEITVYSNATAGLTDMPHHNKWFTCYIQSSGYQTFRGTQKVKLITSKGALRDSWSLTPPGAKWRIHSKTAIRDGVDVLVSSWNIDPRSYQTNLESGIVIKGCSSLAADINEQYEQLRRTWEADEHCPACKAEFLQENMKDSVMCGGFAPYY